MSIIHSFSMRETAKGSLTVSFKQDSKLRRIIFSENTKALQMFMEKYSNNDLLKFVHTSNDKSEVIQDIVKEMKSDYFFKANENNKSIFRPISHKLILKH